MKTLAPILLTVACLSPATGRAETYATCAGFITSIPTTITTQGIWCMDRDLASSLATGNMVTLATSNVTIDCNGFKLGGLAAGTGTQARGIYSMARANVTVRNCNIRGFQNGVYAQGAGSYGHLVENNRMDGNTRYGVVLEGSGHAVCRNMIVDTGGSTISGEVGGIYVSGADVIDNTVDGLYPTTSSPVGSTGVIVLGSNVVIQGNRIRGIVGGTGYAYGIVSLGLNTMIEGNFTAEGTASGSETGILCSGVPVFRNNSAFAFDTGFGAACVDNGGNVAVP